LATSNSIIALSIISDSTVSALGSFFDLLNCLSIFFVKFLKAFLISLSKLSSAITNDV
jgi:hypothetical protein